MTILIFGATGSAGRSVLHTCLSASMVEEVRTITRRPLGVAHEKLRAYIHSDFLNYTSVAEAFSGVDACFFCLGVSVTQVSGEEEYRRITHDFALAAASALHAGSSSALFLFISGKGTDAGSRLMWARVKGETEQELIERFGAVCFRPAAIDAPPSESAPWYYALGRPVIWLLKPFRSLYITGEDLGYAMVGATTENIRGQIFENAGMRDIADRARGRD